jgi:hypothetical protein
MMRQRILLLGWLMVWVAIGFGPGALRAQKDAGQVMPQPAQELLALANRSRAEQGLGPLKWDDALASAARDHTMRMAVEGPIAHRYGGEDDLSTRAGKAGAAYDLIEENVAVGPNAAEIHDEWMHSPGHRANLLNADVNRAGIAVVAVRGVFYATADYTRGVDAMTQQQVETKIASLMRPSGVTILSNPAPARTACAAEGALPVAQGELRPGFVMRWQDSAMNELPKQLGERLASGQYHRAAIGSCSPQNVEGNFTVYRAAVLLY